MICLADSNQYGLIAPLANLEVMLGQNVLMIMSANQETFAGNYFQIVLKCVLKSTMHLSVLSSIGITFNFQLSIRNQSFIMVYIAHQAMQLEKL